MLFSRIVTAQENTGDSHFPVNYEQLKVAIKDAKGLMEYLSTQRKSEWMKIVHEFLKDDPIFLTREQRKILADQIAVDQESIAAITEYQQMRYGAYPDEAWWYFLARLDDPDEKVRLGAVNALSWIYLDNENYIEEIARVLIEMMNKDVAQADHYAVAKVIDLLKKKAQSGSKEAKRLLQEGADVSLKQFDLIESDKKEYPYPGGAAGIFIAGLQDQKLNKAVYKLLGKLGSSNQWVRQSTESAFYQLLPTLQSKLLEDVVKTFLIHIRGQDGESAYKTIEVLGRISFPIDQQLMEQVVERLIIHLKDIGMVRREAARSLGSISPLLSDGQLEKSFKALLNNTGDDSHEIRREVMRALSETVSYLPEPLVKEAIPTFLVRLEDQDQLTRQEAQSGLNNAALRLNGESLEELAEMLIGKLQHPDEYVRGAAALVLKDQVIDRLPDGQFDKAIEAIEQALKIEERGWIQDNLNFLLQSLKKHKKVQ